jgi:hypothetical protein
MTKGRYAIGAALVAAAVMSCTGKDGPTGPPGTANVISGRDTVANADWSGSTVQTGYQSDPGVISFSKPARYLDLSIPQIDSVVAAGGAVLVWMQPDPYDEPTLYVPLPYVFLYIGSGYTYHYEPEILPGKVRVLYYVVDLDNPTSSIDPLAATQATRIFRWVIIPPAAASLVPALSRQPSPDGALAMLATHGFGVENVSVPGR